MKFSSIITQISNILLHYRISNRDALRTLCIPENPTLLPIGPCNDAKAIDIDNGESGVDLWPYLQPRYVTGLFYVAMRDSECWCSHCLN